MNICFLSDGGGVLCLIIKMFVCVFVCLFIHTFLCLSYSDSRETGSGLNLCYGFIPQRQTAWENECREKREEERGGDKYREV